MSNSEITRRGLLGAVAGAAALTIVPNSVISAPSRIAPSDKLNIAGIGVGGMGSGNLRSVASQNIVALCDVDHRYAARTFKAFPKAKQYKDFRVMLEKQKDIDAVMIATPDHTHAVISMAAIKSGKHVFCQKPLTHDVYEARMLAIAAKKAGVITAMGIQGNSGEGHRLIKEWINDGAIGEVKSVDAWCSLSYYPPGHASWSSKLLRRPKNKPPVPNGLDWDLWIGPAPMRPYHSTYHPGTWRSWWDFGSGMMGDRGAHTLDAAYDALELGAPTSVSATSMGLNPDTHPLAGIMTFKFPARGKLPPVTVTWYDGQRPPRPMELEDGRTMGEREGGIVFDGSKGKLMAGIYGGNPMLIPETARRAYKRPAKTLPRVKGSHEMNWVGCCKSGKLPGAHFGYSGPLTEMTVLGNVARRMDTRIEWDAKNMKVTNLPKANQYVKKTYRKGWSL
ncbi:MAG: Gfo/Idh/MocA family oxidoreductase [bacterium]|nr:Gfo/Idh/MocA family oxidoreductase [bacterium]